MSRHPRLLIVKTGQAAQAIAGEHGDHDQWFVDAMGGPERFAVVEAFRGERLPSLKGFDGAIVTGSPLSVCVPAPWMRTTGEVLREWSERGEALLGVCFGHQLLADAFGTPVVKNPKGREIGTIEVELTAAGRRDPLFEGLGPTFKVQATHTDIASDLPAGTTLLALNPCTAVQAARFGARAYGVQFHPELKADTIRTIIRSRLEIMSREGLDGAAIEQNVAESSTGAEILKRFEERITG